MSDSASTTRCYKVREVVDRLGLNTAGIYELIRSGRLVARKFNKRTLILERDLEAFIESLPKIRPKDLVSPPNFKQRRGGRPRKTEVSATEITGAHAST
jgi:hypothetical protein